MCVCMCVHVAANRGASESRTDGRFHEKPIITSRYIKRNNWFLFRVMIAGDKCVLRFVCANEAPLLFDLEPGIIVIIRQTVLIPPRLKDNFFRLKKEERTRDIPFHIN